jgi:site-specific DNA recombinase
MAETLNNKIHWMLSVYGRVSTSLQEDQETIQNQVMAIKEFADKKFGVGNYTLPEEYYYLDEGWSGDNIQRPRLDQLRVDAKKKIWDGVLIYDPDRLARRYSLQELVMDELKEAGIEVFFVTVSTPKNMEDKILYGVRGLFAEYERAKISERFRLGKLRKVKGGHILTTEALYGYHYVRNNKETKTHGYYIINEEEAAVVRMIFTWVGEMGLTLRQVVRELQKLGIKPRKSKRGVWSTSTLTTMLRHKGYIGQAHWGSSYAVVPINPIKIEKYRQVKKTSRRIKPEAEWIAPNIPIPRIIESDELFMKVQAQLKSNSVFNKRRTKNEYLLGGKIYCSCGKKRCGEGPQHGKHLYYRCGDRIYSFPLKPTCKERGINARIADQLVWKEVTALMTSPDRLMMQMDRWLTNRKEKANSSGIDVDVVKKNIQKIETQLDRYNNAHAAGLFSLDKLKEYTLPRNKELQELRTQLRKVEQEENNLNVATIPTENEIQIFSEAVSETLQNLNFGDKQAIIRSTIGKIIGTQHQLQVFGNIPLSLSNVVYKTISRNRRSTKRWQIHAF